MLLKIICAKNFTTFILLAFVKGKDKSHKHMKIIFNAKVLNLLPDL